MALRATCIGETPDRRDRLVTTRRLRLLVAGAFAVVGLVLLGIGCCFGAPGTAVGLYGCCLSLVAGVAASRMVD